MKRVIESKKFHYFTGIAISGAILVWLLASMDWKKVISALAEVQLWPFIPATVLFLGHLFLRAWRWKYLLPGEEKPPIPLLFDCLTTGNLASYVLPLRAGEFVRPYMLTRKTKIAFPTTFTSIVIERFFDLSLVLMSFALMIAFVPGIPAIIYKGAFALGALAIAILLFLITGAFLPFQVQRVAAFVLQPLPEALRKKIERFLDGLLSATAVVRNPRRLAIIIAMSIAVWASIYLCYQVFIALFGISGTLWMGTAVGVITALAVAAPSAPGFIGVYEAGCIAALVLFGVNEETGVAFAIITHAYQYLLIVGLGFFSLYRQNLRFSDVRTLESQGEAEKI